MKIFVPIALIVLIIFSGHYYIISHTDAYVSAIETEVQALEATLERAATIIGRGAVTDAEGHQLHLDIHAHLETITNPHPVAGLTGYQDDHVSSVRVVVEKLEELSVTHSDTIEAIDAAAENHHNELAKKKSSGEQLMNGISNGISDSIDIVSGNIEDV